MRQLVWNKRMLGMAMALCFLAAFGGCAAPQTTSSEASSGLGGLTQYQTDYVGDNSKVGALLQALPKPAGVQQGRFSLQTSAEPYGVTVYYTADQEGVKADFGWMYRNATLILALVDNGDRVTFVMDSAAQQGGTVHAGALHVEFTYTREQTMRRELTDIRVFYKVDQMFNKFLTDQNSRTADDYTRINGNEMTGMLTADQALTALSERFPSVAGKLREKGMMTFGGAACYRFDPLPEAKSPPDVADRFAVSKDGSVFIRIAADYPLVQDL